MKQIYYLYFSPNIETKIETYSTVAVPFKNYLSYSDFLRYIILIGKYTD